jgi:hypothetical protein
MTVDATEKPDVVHYRWCTEHSPETGGCAGADRTPYEGLTMWLAGDRDGGVPRVVMDGRWPQTTGEALALSHALALIAYRADTGF